MINWPQTHKSFLGILPPAWAGAVQAAAIPPARAKLNTTRRRGETEQWKGFGRKETDRSAAVNSPSLCPTLGNDVC